MVIASSIVEMRSLRNSIAIKSLGFVPTMGFLHEGHLSLIRRARAENDFVAVSIYVNPTQFSEDEDLATYPRDLERDLEFLRKENVDFVFTPKDEELYSTGFQTFVTVKQASQPLEGVSRPSHFQGVSTILAKLFNILSPTRVYFGQKDAQQCVVVQQLILDLNYDISIIVCPIVREADGLALSSRNKYLSPEQRHAAPILFRALSSAKQAVLEGERDGEDLRRLMSNMINAESLAKLDYVSAAHPLSLQELDQIDDSVLLSTAVFFGTTRLIDNILTSEMED
ncbi:MAG: pantoate--beta-alanine ligase [Candidatus Promineifilaceae bacterium]|nr:pantoate--beta-alanine ligase [Candidatus Promineifilaceae bacterium]